MTGPDLLLDKVVDHAPAVADREQLLDELETEVGVIIRRAKRRIRSLAGAIHPELPASSFLLLSYVASHGPVRGSDLAELFETDKASISRQIQHLVDLDLVERTSDVADRRVQLLQLSADGHRRLEAVRRQRRTELDQSLADWDQTSLARLVTSLSNYNQAVEPPG